MGLLPDELRQALLERRVVPFVGAGVSRAVRRRDGAVVFCGWKDVLRRAEAAARVKDAEGADVVAAQLKRGKYEKAAAEAKDCLGTDWVRFLEKEFAPEFASLDEASLELARLVWRLGSELLITTNYDRVLEWAAGLEGRVDITSFSCVEANEVAKIHRGAVTRASVWHLHGSMQHPDGIIFTPDGYARLYPENGRPEYEAGIQTLQHVMAGRSLLFVGFGMEASLQSQLAWVEKVYKGGGPKHYVLVAEAQAAGMRESLRALPVEVVSYVSHGAPLLELLREMARAAGPATRTWDRTQYLQWLENECAYIKLQALKIGSGSAGQYPIDELYIEPMARGREKELPLGEAVGGLLNCVVEGDAGSGKSTFLKKLAWDCCRAGKRFPILVRIAEFDLFLAGRGVGVDEAPAGLAEGRWLPYYLGRREWGLDEAFFAEMLGKAETVVLLDGLDEAVDEGRRTRVARIVEAARRLYPQCQFVVTTRPSAHEGTAVIAGFEIVRIEDLGPAQIGRFLGLWSMLLHHGNETGAATHRAALEKALERVEIRRMARNPLMLTALAVVQWNDKVLPEQRAALYESILTWLAKAKAEEKKRPWEGCLQRMGVLALGMQSYADGHRVSLGRGDAAVLLAGEFGGDVGAARRFLLAEEVDSGIITSSGDELRFWHRTFEEYLAAWRLSGMTDEALWAGAEPYLYVREWREVMLLLAGCLCEAKGHGRLHLFLRKVLGTAGDSLATQARCVALVVGMLNDLRAAKYVMESSDAARYEELKRSVQAVFTVEGAAKVPASVRADVGDALGVEGHPSLYLPGDARYWVRVKGGKFLMGAQSKDKKGVNYDEEALDDREPVRETEVGVYWMGRYPVTVYEYGRFLEAHESREKPSDWEEQVLTPTRPVGSLTHEEAAAYCAWVGGRLPKEEEWEFAARGTEGREYPWGAATPDEWRANYTGAGVDHPSAVGLFPGGETAEGISELAGNVWEWTASDYSEGRKVVRGGAYWVQPVSLRGAFRLDFGPGYRSYNIGFRCIRD